MEDPDEDEQCDPLPGSDSPSPAKSQNDEQGGDCIPRGQPDARERLHSPEAKVREEFSHPDDGRGQEGKHRCGHDSFPG